LLIKQQKMNFLTSKSGNLLNIKKWNGNYIIS